MKKALAFTAYLVMLIAAFSLVALGSICCFAEIPVYISSDGLWKYTLINGNEAYLSSADLNAPAYLGNDSNVIVPSYIDGHKVMGISKYAFAGIDSITSISVPDTVVDDNLDYEADLPGVSQYYCYKNSDAAKAAKSNSYLSALIRYFGDVDGDGNIELDDYSAVLQYLTDSQSAGLDEQQLRAADYDADTSVDAFDLFYINKICNSGMKIGSDLDDDSHYAIIDWG